MSAQRRRVLVGAKIPDGVYIEGLDGKVYTVDDWQGGDAANSVVVASGDVKFRIALQQPSPMKITFNNDSFEDYMVSIWDKTEALSDYDGAGNTVNMLKVEPSTSYAAGYCNAFTFPNGKTKGFLPSLGQLYLASQNKVAVDAALAACGGTAMQFNYNYHTSTFTGKSGTFYRFFWTCGWGGNVSFVAPSDDSYVRPFADIS